MVNEYWCNGIMGYITKISGNMIQVSGEMTLFTSLFTFIFHFPTYLQDIPLTRR